MGESRRTQLASFCDHISPEKLQDNLLLLRCLENYLKETSNKSTICGTSARLSEAIIRRKNSKLKKRDNSKTKAFSYTPCHATAPCHDEQVFQVYMVLIPLILFEYRATLKFLHDDDDNNDDLAITVIIAELFLLNRQTKNHWPIGNK